MPLDPVMQARITLMQRQEEKRILGLGEYYESWGWADEHWRKANGIAYWMTHHTQTFDEHAKEKGVAVYKPFPDAMYFLPCLYYMSLDKRMAIPKSRQMMASWLVAAYLVYEAQFNPRTRCIIQCEKEEKANGLIEYAKCIYDRQPQWLKDRYPLAGDQLQSKSLVLFANESRVQGIPGTPDQIRSNHPTILFIDEAAHILQIGACYATADHVCSKIILVSSAAPGWFGDLCDPESMPVQLPPLAAPAV